MGIGERVKQVRDKFGLNQRDFAARLGTGAGRISMIESGQNVPGGDLLVRLHAEFGVDLNWLLTGVTATGEVPVAPLAPDEAALLDNYRNSPEDQQRLLRETGAAFAQSKVKKGKVG